MSSTPKTEPVSSNLRDRLAANVKKLRSDQNLSQEELSTLAGFHRSYISQVERCVTNISLDNIEKISIALRIDAVELLKN